MSQRHAQTSRPCVGPLRGHSGTLAQASVLGGELFRRRSSSFDDLSASVRIPLCQARQVEEEEEKDDSRFDGPAQTRLVHAIRPRSEIDREVPLGVVGRWYPRAV